MPRSERYPDYPSVTEVLSSCQLVREYPDNAATLAARRRGQVLHKAIELHHADRLDIESLDPRVRPYFDAYLDYLGTEDAYRPRRVRSEYEVVSHNYGVVGHIDQVADTLIYDFKTGEDIDLLGARRQLGAYTVLFEEQEQTKPSDTLILQLRRNGKYQLHRGWDPYQQEVFKAAVMVFYEKGKK